MSSIVQSIKYLCSYDKSLQLKDQSHLEDSGMQPIPPLHQLVFCCKCMPKSIISRYRFELSVRTRAGRALGFEIPIRGHWILDVVSTNAKKNCYAMKVPNIYYMHILEFSLIESFNKRFD